MTASYLCIEGVNEFHFEVDLLGLHVDDSKTCDCLANYLTFIEISYTDALILSNSEWLTHLAKRLCLIRCGKFEGVDIS